MSHIHAERCSGCQNHLQQRRLQCKWWPRFLSKRWYDLFFSFTVLSLQLCADYTRTGTATINWPSFRFSSLTFLCFRFSSLAFLCFRFSSLAFLCFHFSVFLAIFRPTSVRRRRLSTERQWCSHAKRSKDAIRRISFTHLLSDSRSICTSYFGMKISFAAGVAAALLSWFFHDFSANVLISPDLNSSPDFPDSS